MISRASIRISARADTFGTFVGGWPALRAGMRRLEKVPPIRRRMSSRRALPMSGPRAFGEGDDSVSEDWLTSPVRPDFRSSRYRSESAPATHVDQDVGALAGVREWSQVLGAYGRPRKSSSSTGRVHVYKTTQTRGCPEGLQHLLARGRRTGRSPSQRSRGGANQTHRFVQAPILAPSPARVPIGIACRDRTSRGRASRRSWPGWLRSRSFVISCADRTSWRARGT